jgi:hypothetical protein
VSVWEHERAARRMRQWPALERIRERVGASTTLLGLVLVGSFAAGTFDALSDLDLFLFAREDGFEESWARRHELHGDGALAVWDRRDPGLDRAAAHKWVTGDLVLVECLIATPSSGVRLAEPAVVVAGDPGLLGLVPRRPPVDRAELTRRPVADPVERAYDDLKAAVRAARANSSGEPR